MATSAAAAIAAAAARARRETFEHFDDVGAINSGRAIRYQPPSHLHERQFELLIGQGILKETGVGRFWIDSAAVRMEAEQRRHALKILLVIILASFVIAAISLALIRIR